MVDKPWLRQQLKDLKTELAADNLTAVEARLTTIINTISDPGDILYRTDLEHAKEHLLSALKAGITDLGKSVQKERVLRTTDGLNV